VSSQVYKLFGVNTSLICSSSGLCALDNISSLLIHPVFFQTIFWREITGKLNIENKRGNK